MSDEPQQAMTSERLERIRARVECTDEPVIYWNGPAGALEQAEEDRAALLAEVERLLAREAALEDALIAQARALLASAAEAAPGEAKEAKNDHADL